MAAPLFLGTVTVHGLDGTVAYTGMATTDNLPEGLDLEDTTEEHEAKDKAGETVGLKLWNPRANLTINFYPCKAAGTNAIANAKLNVVLPARGSKVTIAGEAEATNGAIPVSGNLALQKISESTWLYVNGGRISKTNTGDVKMTLPLRRYNTDIANVANT